MERVLNNDKKEEGETLGIEGGTDSTITTKSDVIVQTSHPVFMHYLHADLEQETTKNVVKIKKLTSIKKLENSSVYIQ